MTVLAEFAVPSTAFVLGESVSTQPAVIVETERVVPVGRPIQCVWLAGDGRGAVIERLRADDRIDALVVIDELSDRTLLRLEYATNGAIVRAINDVNAVLVEIAGIGETWTVRLRFRDRDAIATFRDQCEEYGVTIDLQRTNEGTSSHPGTPFDLTESQREAVLAAFSEGYFEVPRDASLSALADTLDISDQAVSERLRRGIATLLAATLETDDPERSRERDQRWFDES